MCELFRSYLYDPKQNRSTAGFQTFDIGPHILPLKKTTKQKNLQSTKDHIVTVFNPFTLGGKKGHIYLNKPAAKS